MHHFLVSSLGVMILSAVFSAHAAPDSAIDIPDKVRSNILKRHPKAQEMQATHETHFGQKLLEVRFKDENDQEVLELFTSQAHLFTDEETLEGTGEISPAAIEALKNEFSNYTPKKMELIVNPNGVGEEYEIYLHANGSDWKVSVNDKGNIIEKQQLAP